MANGPSPKLTAFRNCWEASMTFEEALGCAGLADSKPELIEVLRRFWDGLEKQFSAACRVEEILARRECERFYHVAR